MIRPNGYKLNATIRRSKKDVLYLSIVGILATFRIKLKDAAEIAGVNKGTLQNGLCNTSLISVKKLQQVEKSLLEYVEANCKDNSRYKIFNIQKGIENEHK